MREILNEAEHYLGLDPKLADFEAREEDGELHLIRGDDRFARLIPDETKGIWRMEYFRNEEQWELLDFRGTLKECLDYIADNLHFLFWEG
ncbi:MAG: hypothetical protein P8Z70_08730 [Desulfuromonadales bacterium]